MIIAGFVAFTLPAVSKPNLQIKPIVSNPIGQQHHYPADDAGESQSSADIEQPKSIKVVPEQNPPKSDTNKKCVENPDKSRDDMAIALQSAKASERQADYAELSLWVGAIAALATAWAAYEAARAARAAVRATDIAEMSLTNIEAPFIFPVFDFPEIEYGPAKIKCVETARMRLKNFGKTPGVVHQLYYRPVQDKEIISGPIEFPKGQVSIYSEIIGSGDFGNAISLTSIQRQWGGIKWSYSGGDVPFVIGLIRYSDVNGSQFICGFFYSMNPSNWSFSPIGGKKFNYRRKLTDEEIKAAENNLSEKPAIG